MIADN